ncbi:beta-fructofuranosidase, insoluble isoenzyme CWINV3-like isoform X2 [Euphorbia lathyris]|uniref:beta-fructofuranosidase, insoluble isoenzyme CWINV3-like isoform X2 n=1 Tax=Euphorbia lathyris TaxID=212925 RepID=UPI0033133F19
MVLGKISLIALKMMSRKDSLDFRQFLGKQLLEWPIEEINELRGKKLNIQQETLDGGSILEIRDINASEVEVEQIDVADTQVPGNLQLCCI